MKLKRKIASLLALVMMLSAIFAVPVFAAGTWNIGNATLVMAPATTGWDITVRNPADDADVVVLTLLEAAHRDAVVAFFTGITNANIAARVASDLPLHGLTVAHVEAWGGWDGTNWDVPGATPVAGPQASRFTFTIRNQADDADIVVLSNLTTAERDDITNFFMGLSDANVEGRIAAQLPLHGLTEAHVRAWGGYVPAAAPTDGNVPGYTTTPTALRLSAEVRGHENNHRLVDVRQTTLTAPLRDAGNLHSVDLIVPHGVGLGHQFLPGSMVMSLGGDAAFGAAGFAFFGPDAFDPGVPGAQIPRFRPASGAVLTSAPAPAVAGGPGTGLIHPDNRPVDPAHVGFFTSNADGTTRTAVTDNFELPIGASVFYTGAFTQAGQGNEVSFRMEHMGGGRLHITWNAQAATSNDILRIPIIANITGDGEITLNVNPESQGFTPQINNQTLSLTGDLAAGATTFTSGAVAIGEDVIRIGALVIRENRPGAWNFDRGTGVFNHQRAITVRLPEGYVFAPRNVADPGIRVELVTGGGMVNIAHNAIGNTPPNWAAINGVTANLTAWYQVNPENDRNELVMLLPQTGGQNRQFAGSIRLEGFEIRRDAGPWEPITGDTVTVELVGGAVVAPAGVPDNQAGGAIRRLPNPLGTIAGASQEVARFEERAVSFGLVPDVEVPEIRAGRAFRDGMTSSQTSVPAVVDDFAGAAARVRLQENIRGSIVPAGLGSRGNVELTLTDANGNVLPEAKIAGIQLHTWGVNATGGAGTDGAGAGRNPQGFGANVTFHNQRTVQGGTGIVQVNAGGTTVDATSNGRWVVGGAANIRGNTSTVFSDDGHSVRINNLGVGQDAAGFDQRLRLEATIFLSTAPHFEGDVYVTFVQPGGWGVAAATHTVRIATVVPQIEVTAAQTNVNIGFQTFPVSNVVIAERVAGALQAGAARNIQLSLNEFGIAPRAGLGFNPIAQGNVAVAGHTTETNRVDARVLPGVLGAGGGLAGVNVARASRLEPSRITLSGLSVHVTHAVPFGYYDLVIGGSAVTDVDTNIINAGIADPQPTQNLFRRYAFAGFTVERYVNVITPGQGVGVAATARIVIPHAEGSTFTVDGVTHTFQNAAGDTITSRNVDGRLFVPLRAVTEALGAQVIFHEGAGDLPHQVEVRLSGITAVWTIGQPTFTVGGNTFPMATAGVEVRPFIAPEVAATYLPIRYIMNAFGIPFEAEANGSVIINPTAADLAGAGTGTGTVATGNDVEDEDEEYEND